MYIEPNSTVILMKDIPWNSNYESTMWFGDTIAQATYFANPDKIVKTFDKQSYVRPSGSSGGVIDVKELADNLYNVNYMAFRNINFGGKWFYAFVTSVEYVNNKTTRVYFEIDLMQTWLVGTEATPNDYTLNECFVEREHSATDNIGDNLIDEGLELGDYYYKRTGRAQGFDNGYYPVVATSFESITINEDGTITPEIADGDIYSNVYSGLKYRAFTYLSSLNTYLRQITEANRTDGIVSIFMIPSDFVEDVNLKITKSIITYEIVNYDNINGYTPKNKKLFCYPYNMIYVTDNAGNYANFPYEYFEKIEDNNDLFCQFKCEIAISPVPEAHLVPFAYKTNESVYNYNERMVINDFPQCAFTIDSYRAWVAQNAIPLTANVGSTIAGAVFSGAVSGGVAGAVIGGVSSAIGSVTNALAQKHVASTLPPQARGSQTGVMNMASNLQGFTFYNAQIRAEFAKIIDDYFQKYGYATKQVKIPNTNVREHWTYVKTIGCTITGSLPADDEVAICNIFDNGITFFKDEESFKAQSTTINRPLSEVNVSG